MNKSNFGLHLLNFFKRTNSLYSHSQEDFSKNINKKPFNQKIKNSGTHNQSINFSERKRKKKNDHFS